MDLEQKIRDVQCAIQQLEAIKSHLDKNTSEAKSNMNSTFMRHLRSLWNRQVFLASQVDLIHSTKEQVLHRQLVRLHSLMANLQSQLGISDSDTNFDMNDLKPEETPYISFRADTASLKDAIVNYGRVNHTGFPLTSQFMDPRSPAASLPPHFEDYDDAEHHILYKTVEEIKHAKTNSRDIDVHIPKLSARPEDWLSRSVATTTMSASQPTFSFPVFSTNTSDWLRPAATTEVSASGQRPIMSVMRPTEMVNTSPSLSFVSTSSVTSGSALPPSSGSALPLGVPSSSTTSSIDTWLLQIKQNPDMEDEDDFEIVDGSGPLGVLDPEESSDQRVFSLTTPSASTVSWLKESGAPDVNKGQETGHDVMASYFDKRTNDMSAWLAPNKKTSCCGESCCDKPNISFEIENLGDYLASKLWLKSSSSSEMGDQVSWLCKANEPCQTFADCLGSPSCLEEHQISGMGTSDLPGFSIFKHNSDNKKWLTKGGKNVAPTTKCYGFEHFQRASKEVADWLLKENVYYTQPDPSVITSPEFAAGHEDTENKMWLRLDEVNRLPQSTTPIQSCTTWDRLMTQHDGIGDNEWLLPPTAHTAKLAWSAPQEGDTETWLLHEESMDTETPSKDNLLEFPMMDKEDTFWLQG